MEHHSGLNVVDLGVIAVVLISGALALWRGLVREVLSLAAWTGAVLITVYFYPSLRPWMHAHIKNEFGADVATGFSLFCVALLILLPLGYFLSSFIRGRALTAIDRSFGFVFGIARGVLIVSLLFLVTLWVWPEKEREPEALAQARSRPLLVSGAEAMKNLLPQEEMKKVTERLNAIEKPAPEPRLDQPPTPTNVTGTVNAKSDAVSETKPGTTVPVQNQVRQITDQQPNSPTDKPATKP